MADPTEAELRAAAGLPPEDDEASLRAAAGLPAEGQIDTSSQPTTRTQKLGQIFSPLKGLPSTQQLLGPYQTNPQERQSVNDAAQIAATHLRRGTHLSDANPNYDVQPNKPSDVALGAATLATLPFGMAGGAKAVAGPVWRALQYWVPGGLTFEGIHQAYNYLMGEVNGPKSSKGGGD